MFKKIFSLLYMPYLLTYLPLSMMKRSEKFPNIDFSFLIFSNVYFVLLTGFVIYFVQKSSQYANPHVFVSRVMGGMFAKMMLTALAFIIALSWIKKIGAADILICLLIYLIYLAVEVRFLMKNQKKADA